MAQANEQKNISFEDVWGKSASANIISGKVATPLCLAFLGVCHNEKDSAHSLNRIMQALARCQLNEELLLLLEIICDIADMDYPQELIAAINDSLGADDLVRELMLNQAPTYRMELARLLNISDTQLSYITNAEAGHGLIKVGGAIVPFINDFPKDTALYRLMTTKPEDAA